MDIRFIPNERVNKESNVFIGKTGILRIKKTFAQKNNLLKNEFYLVGIDENEKGNYKKIFLVKAEKHSAINAHKITELGDVYILNLATFLQTIGLKVPFAGSISPFSEGSFVGFQINLLQTAKSTRSPLNFSEKKIEKNAIQIENVSHFEAKAIQSLCYLKTGEVIELNKNLKKIEECYSKYPFIKRVHRSYIINTNFIERISDDKSRFYLPNNVIVPNNWGLNV